MTGPRHQDDFSPSDDAPDDPEYRKSLEFLYDRIDYERMAGGASQYPFRLTRMRKLLDRLGLECFLHPTPAAIEPALRKPQSPNSGPPNSGPPNFGPPNSGPLVVHVAGTKGKGSTASMVAAILTASGRKTGLYTSPHLQKLEERFTIDGEICRPAELVALVNRVRPIDETLIADQTGAASFFELTTALALLHFHQSGCDAVVLETGLGGRLDSTNVCQPHVTAITSIGLDHQLVLGDTLAKIAAEKAGIIKPGVPVISGVMATEPAQVIEQMALNQGSPLFKIGRDFSVDWRPDPVWGSHITFRGITDPLSERMVAEVAMEGEHQARNAALAIAIVQTINQRVGGSITHAAIVSALSTLRCDGRIQRYALAGDVTGIVDAAHNEDSIAALCQTLRRRTAGGPVAIVFGTSVDKSAGPMLQLIADLTDHIDLRNIQVTRFSGNPRWRPTRDLMNQMPAAIEPIANVNEDPLSACQTALRSVTPGGTLVVCGSFFLAAETEPWMRSIAISPTR